MHALQYLRWQCVSLGMPPSSRGPYTTHSRAVCARRADVSTGVPGLPLSCRGGTALRSLPYYYFYYYNYYYHFYVIEMVCDALSSR